MGGAERSRASGDLTCGRFHGGGQRVDEVVDGPAARNALPQGRDQGLRIRGCWDNEPITALAGGRDSTTRCAVVSVLGVENGDQDPGVEDGQAHSRRRSSR